LIASGNIIIRRGRGIKGICFGIWGAFGILIPFIGIGASFCGIGIVSLVSFLIAGLIQFFMLYGKNRDYTAYYKSKVIQEILKQFDPSLSYSVKKGFPKSDFKESGLYQHPDDYLSGDLIDGYYGKTKVKVGEVFAKKLKSRNSVGGGRCDIIFEGLYVIADFHKHFSGETYVLPDRSKSKYGDLGKSFQKSEGKKGTKLIQMDDPEFEHSFAIYSTSEIESRYILSNSMMQNILKMKKRLRSNEVKIAFKNSTLYMGVSGNMNYLEPRMDIPATNEAQIRRFISEVMTLLQIVEDLNLNTRIWTKE